MVKHAAMAQRPDIRINCPIGKLVGNRICDTITQPKSLKASDAIYRAGNYLVFKSDIPHTVDVFEIRPDKKLRPVASFMRDADKYALGAAKRFLLTKV